MPTDDAGLARPPNGPDVDNADPPALPRKVGRPPRISREKIAVTAHEIGPSDLTLKAVADRLEVSVAALYHHIDGKDDLSRLVAEHAAARVKIPEDTGQHWALWLWEWARYNREAFVSQPGLLGQYLEGAISAESIAANMDASLGLLVRQGFELEQALEAYELVSSCAIGSALGAIRDNQAAAAGRSLREEYRRILAERGPDDLPTLRALVDGGTKVRALSFDSKLTKVLVGIAVTRGEDPQPVIEAIEAARGDGLP